jgi:predicted glycosyltransferase
MVERLHGARILIYSHDSFGLGHLRRCRAIAHALVDRFKGLSILILSGSPIIGSFDFRARVDFVRIPGVIKLHDGDYQSLGLHIDVDQTMEMRAAIIRQTALSFSPDVFIVDKEPLGLKARCSQRSKCSRRWERRSCSGFATSWTSRDC